MLKKVIFIFFILSIKQINFAQTIDISSKKYAVNEINKDIHILKQMLLNTHPSIGFYHSDEWYKNYFDTALNIHKELTEKELRFLLKRKLNILHCGHTGILASRRYSKYLSKKTFKTIPYYIAYFPPYLINIKGIEKKDTLLSPYDTIIKINHTLISDIAKEFAQYLYVDGAAETAQQEMLQKNLIFYYSAFYDQDSFLITKIHKQTTADVYIKAQTFKHLNNELWDTKSDTLMKKYGGKFYAGTYLDNKKNIYYMKIKVFSGISMKKFFRQTFRKLNKHNTQVLILDLRNNPGGKISQCLNLLSYLLPVDDSLFYESRIHQLQYKKYLSKKLEFKIIRLFMKINKHKNNGRYVDKIKRKKNYHYHGQLYIITNCNTFSAANLTTVYLSKKRPYTKLVGTETSGVVWGSNAVNFLKLTLPNTKIRILIPSFRIYHNIKNTSDKDSMLNLIPDIHIHYTPSDYSNHKDKALEAIYQDLIKK